MEISPGPVSAVTVTIDVIGVPEFVMNDFSPSITHCPLDPSSVARVRVPPASLPASGSVSPNPPSVRPAHRSGSQRSCCSGVPNLWIGLAPRPTPASSVMASDWSARAISSMATHSPVRSPPPPYGSGNGMPNSPSSPILQHGVDGERVVAVPRLGVRLDLGLDELADDPPQRLVLLGQFRVHASPTSLRRRRCSGLLDRRHP